MQRSKCRQGIDMLGDVVDGSTSRSHCVVGRTGAPSLLIGLGGCAAQKPRGAGSNSSPSRGSTPSRPGHKLTTAHYEIYTTLRDEVLVNALPDFVEAAYENYPASSCPPVQEPDERMKVYLFATRGQWEGFTRRFARGRVPPSFLKVRNGGYSEQGVSVIEYVAHQITFPLFAHEGFHQYLHHYVGTSRFRAWVNEGLAVYCEGQRWGSYPAQGVRPVVQPQAPQ